MGRNAACEGTYSLPSGRRGCFRGVEIASFRSMLLGTGPSSSMGEGSGVPCSKGPGRGLRPDSECSRSVWRSACPFRSAVRQGYVHVSVPRLLAWSRHPVPRLETRTKECKRHASLEGGERSVTSDRVPQRPTGGEVRASGCSIGCESPLEGRIANRAFGHAVAGFE